MLVELIQSIAFLAPIATELALAMTVIVVVVLTFLAYVVSRGVIARILRRLFTEPGSRHEKLLVEHQVFRRLSHVAPAILFNVIATDVFDGTPQLAAFFDGVSLIYLTIVVAVFANALINALLAIYQTYDFSRDIPLTSIAQTAKLLVYFLAAVVIASVSLGEPLNAILAGLGALTAGAAFVFKDSILGFVAGLQLTSNSMVAVGDWIEAPDLGVDGDVVEIGMTTVKVRNFDRTITTFPTQALISGSFKNWRGMKETGGRRIKRAILIDFASVKFCDADMIQRLSGIVLLADHLAMKQAEIATNNAAGNAAGDSGNDNLVNGRRLTNVGVLRAYLEAYLRAHPKVRNDLTLLVRQLSPIAEGLPIEVYAFTDTTDWTAYEAIQADIFDHILAAVNEFDLRIAQAHPGA